MKKAIANLCNIIFLFLAVAASAQEGANGQYPFVKERNIHKSYPANGKSLTIDNKFGAVKVIVWNKKEISIDVHMVASSTDDTRAAAMFKAINVWDSLTGNVISFTTTDGRVKGKECAGCKSKWTIDYVIHLPTGTTLAIKNAFGQIDVPDYTGSLSLENDHGGISTGNLANLTKISVSFGKVQIMSIKNSNAVFKWSSVEIAKLPGDNLLLFDNCRSVILGVDKDVAVLSITETFSTINIKPAKNFAAEYFVKTNGIFKNTSNTVIAEIEDGIKKADSRIKQYHGKSGNGEAKILVKSNFGDILLGG